MEEEEALVLLVVMLLPTGNRETAALVCLLL
jgi:hypothetical protein